jgi:GTPase SAR1 family protein
MGNADAKLLLIGLDNSGKTTILSRIIDPDIFDINITPTIGFKKGKFSRNAIDFEVYDMSG